MHAFVDFMNGIIWSPALICFWPDYWRCIYAYGGSWRDYERQRKDGVEYYTFDPVSLGIKNAEFWEDRIKESKASSSCVTGVEN